MGWPTHRFGRSPHPIASGVGWAIHSSATGGVVWCRSAGSYATDEAIFASHVEKTEKTNISPLKSEWLEDENVAYEMVPVVGNTCSFLEMLYSVWKIVAGGLHWYLASWSIINQVSFSGLNLPKHLNLLVELSISPQAISPFIGDFHIARPTPHQFSSNLIRKPLKERTCHPCGLTKPIASTFYLHLP